MDSSVGEVQVILVFLSNRETSQLMDCLREPMISAEGTKTFRLRKCSKNDLRFKKSNAEDLVLSQRMHLSFLFNANEGK